MKKALLLAAVVAFAGSANAEYWHDGEEAGIVRSEFGLCWVNAQGTYDDELDHLLQCGDAEIVKIENKRTLTIPSNDVPGGAINFDFDGTILGDKAKQTIAEAAHILPADANVTITGHTDAVGTAAYNTELGWERAKIVAAELAANGGPAAKVKSLGENQLLVATEGRDRANRRAEVYASYTVMIEEARRYDRPATAEYF